MLHRWILMAVVAGLVLGGCSDDDESGKDSGAPDLALEEAGPDKAVTRDSAPDKEVASSDGPVKPEDLAPADKPKTPPDKATPTPDKGPPPDMPKPPPTASWKVITKGIAGKTLTALWGSGAKDIYAVGHSGTILHNSGVTFVAVPVKLLVNLEGIWGTGPTDVWAVGGDGVILHYD